jgi:hypothetical protein
MISTYISRENSNAVKGIAILFMLFLHLFNRVTDGVEYVWVGEQPLTKFLSTAAYPVPFFLMMSGYGLFYTYKQQRLNTRSTTKRTFKLYIHYWIVLLLFVTIGVFVAPNHYPGNFVDVVNNVTGIKCTYNYETWFLLPYVVLSFLAPLLFRIMDKVLPWQSLAVSFFISYGASFIVSRYIMPGILNNTILVFIIVTAGLLFEFVIGACMMQLSDNNRVNGKPIISNGYLGLILFIVFVLLRCFIRIPWDAFYSALIVLLFINTKRPKWLDKILEALGKKSMIMWMVHTYFSIYLFHDFIYGFKYPVVIYLVLICISYVVAVLIGYLAKILLNVVCAKL